MSKCREGALLCAIEKKPYPQLVLGISAQGREALGNDSSEAWISGP